MVLLLGHSWHQFNRDKSCLTNLITLCDELWVDLWIRGRAVDVLYWILVSLLTWSPHSNSFVFKLGRSNLDSRAACGVKAVRIIRFRGQSLVIHSVPVTSGALLSRALCCLISSSVPWKRTQPTLITFVGVTRLGGVGIVHMVESRLLVRGTSTGQTSWNPARTNARFHMWDGPTPVC